MSDPPVLAYQSIEQTPREMRQLRWLSTAHFVAALLLAAQLPAMFGSFFFFLNPVRPTLRGFFREFSRQQVFVPSLWYFCFGLVAAGSGFLISRRRLRLVSMLIAALLCFLIPFGTAVGLPALILLQRRATRILYRSSASHRLTG